MVKTSKNLKLILRKTHKKSGGQSFNPYELSQNFITSTVIKELEYKKDRDNNNITSDTGDGYYLILRRPTSVKELKKIHEHITKIIYPINLNALYLMLAEYENYKLKSGYVFNVFNSTIRDNRKKYEEDFREEYIKVLHNIYIDIKNAFYKEKNGKPIYLNGKTINEPSDFKTFVTEFNRKIAIIRVNKVNDENKYYFKALTERNFIIGGLEIISKLFDYVTEKAKEMPRDENINNTSEYGYGIPLVDNNGKINFIDENIDEYNPYYKNYNSEFNHHPPEKPRKPTTTNKVKIQMNQSSQSKKSNNIKPQGLMTELKERISNLRKTETELPNKTTALEHQPIQHNGQSLTPLHIYTLEDLKPHLSV